MTIDIGCVRDIAAHFKDTPGGLLPALHELQDSLGHVPAEAVPVLAGAFNLSRAEVHGVVTYYHHFRSEPAGRHIVQICRAEACQAMGAQALIEHAQGRLSCELDSRAGDGRFSLESVYCLGLCASSPALLLDGAPHARVTPERFDTLVAPLQAGKA